MRFLAGVVGMAIAAIPVMLSLIVPAFKRKFTQEAQLTRKKRRMITRILDDETTE